MRIDVDNKKNNTVILTKINKTKNKNKQNKKQK